MISALYEGAVVHVRTRPVRRRLRYRVAQMLLDLEELPRLDRELRWFGYNRAALFSFHDRDHGDGSANLRGWVTGKLAAAGCAFRPGAIRLLCMPRVLGHDREGRLAAILYEVNNTFGERHSYVIAVDGAEGSVLRQQCDKAFYVSPFLPMDLLYSFSLRPPADTVSVQVAASDAQGLLLDAWFTGRRRPLGDAQLLAAMARFPLMTLKVLLAIHWEALKIWLSGVPFVPRPALSRPPS
jgi:DUF1365 family protein